MLSRRHFVLASAYLACAGLVPARADQPVIAAASDLQFALEEIAAAFQDETGLAVRLAFGSSGNFARQIRQAAPFEIYLSADESYVLDLARDRLTIDEGHLYAVGRIAVWVPAGSALEADGSLNNLRAALDDGRLDRIAIANPEHAPYGVAARQALEAKGLWDAIEPRLVLGENVSQAAQFAATGAAQVGLIAYSLALSPRLAAAGSHELVPAEMHAPLNQRMVLLRNAGDTSRRFYAYLRGEAAQEIFARHGFVVPDLTE